MPLRTTTPATPPGGASVRDRLGALALAALARVKEFLRAYRNRGNAAVLAGFDDRMLADIGLSRSDLRDAFAGPLWDDPTSLLRARALERRLSRRGAGLGLAPTRTASPPLVPYDAFDRPRTDRPARFTV